MRDQYIPPGQGPAARPTQVLVLRGTDWVESAAALAALNKRLLYPPAGWPEELDDRTSAAGPLRVTYERTGNTLLLRVRVTGRVPTCAIHGPVTLLGHHARTPPPRGWHPATLVVGDAAQVELRLNQPVSRALLAYA